MLMKEHTTIRKGQMVFSGYMIGREVSENIMMTRKIISSGGRCNSGAIMLDETDKCFKLIRTIGCRQSKFFGHVRRKNKLENLVATGKFDGE